MDLAVTFMQSESGTQCHGYPRLIYSLLITLSVLYPSQKILFPFVYFSFNEI